MILEQSPEVTSHVTKPIKFSAIDVAAITNLLQQYLIFLIADRVTDTQVREYLFLA